MRPPSHLAYLLSAVRKWRGSSFCSYSAQSMSAEELQLFMPGLHDSFQSKKFHVSGCHFPLRNALLGILPSNSRFFQAEDFG